MKLVLPYPPALNSMYKCWRGRVVLSNEAREYKRLVPLSVAAQMREQKAGMIHGEVAATLHFYRPRRGDDIDGRFKCLFDALNKVAYADDEQIAQLHAFREVDKRNPRVEIEITELSLC